MARKFYQAGLIVIVLAIIAMPVAAAQAAEGVSLPDWVAWLLVFLALFLPLVVLANRRRS
jgi:hypothetical protein